MAVLETSNELKFHAGASLAIFN